MKTVLISVFLCLLAIPANAQPFEKPPPTPAVTATAEAVITVEPDQAEMDIGVVSQARNAPDAAKENAEKLSRVLAQVKKILGSGDEVKTAAYSLTPNYRYPQGGKPEITGYTASNTLRIRTGNLDTVGKLIDAAMQSGANNINRLVFTLKNEQNAQLQALRIASQKAKAKADEMAAAVGLQAIRVLSIVEGERGFRPVPVPQLRAAQMEAMPAAPTPVEAGTIEVRSTVTVTAELAPR